MSVRQKTMGDYIGFTYGDKHSSELGIVRVSDGSRFNQNLLPTIQDKTVQIPGGDGTYYFGSYYTQRQFSISFAFDDLTEEEIATLRRHFGDKKIHDLIFDETPYKAYQAKVTGTATLKYLVFDDGPGNERIYKGEGTIQFTCYNPFAKCTITRQKDETSDETRTRMSSEYTNIDEWWGAAGIDWGTNFGDVPVPFKLNISSDDDSTKIGIGEIDWSKLPSETLAQINTKTGTVLQLDKDGEVTSTLLNRYVTGNLTAKIPVGGTAPTDAIFTCLYI